MSLFGSMSQFLPQDIESQLSPSDVKQNSSNQKLNRSAFCVLRACGNCRRLKTKCDNTRPCSRCLARGIASTCTDWAKDKPESRKQVSKACEPCRRLKERCDDERPCKRCCKRGRTHLCVDSSHEDTSQPKDSPVNQQSPMSPVPSPPTEINKSVSPIEQVDRPLAFKANTASFGIECGQALEGIFTGSTALVKRFNEFGFNSSQNLKMFLTMPPKLQDMLKEGVRFLENMFVLKDDGISTARHNIHLLENDNASNLSNCEDSEISALENFSSLHGSACVRIRYDPEESRRKDVCVTNSMTKLTGLHKEELLTRFAAKDIPFYMTELDQFCKTIEGAFHANDVLLERYYRVKDIWSEKPKGCIFCKLSQCRQFDGRGRVLNQLYYFNPVSPEEFDRVQRENPEMCRPFAREMGDFRTSNELMNDFQVDMES
ncbi:hypothetical protein GUITHDRAFT_161937 [Guillardia theta CCMP2712]|uniref:Zn(2)-C6 fungal-type domain-containing protein n=1 Tax=Guillardia theta (strain CCMP2712) TaxID=905079 RepID=L1JQ99_GUITC|nr:hypothetical protein GUITHDRAFT_161937 [Guillardia theta CCMP2712]EKX50345.1 hypothetical protein GUITHDRAFT_161937 [Guillardia theta CCMP2712]|eukprot:XP_005837325.1 hypothetical protein GUITHDRAFT_161937 [Guillardia theta CCMP2712]